MPTMVFNYSEKKIKKLDELAGKESRSRSSYIQKVLFGYLKKKGVVPGTKKTVKIRKK
jgi:predicted transcriptional regulator